ncbi:MAG: Tim44/TimA family putative adaptor protein [Alphaproteobacteria bacterium]|nr:Tim44/TimA family putative adaptor protein [Alphaproteobacteria bacterium]
MSYTTITTIIAALVAVLVLFKLYSVLGKRTGNERQRSVGIGKGFAKAPEITAQAGGPFRFPPDGGDSNSDYPKSLAAQLREVADLDNSFNEKEFLAGARNAFNSIVTAFNRGDLTEVEKWISPEVIAVMSSKMPKVKKSRTLPEDSAVKSINEIEVLQAQIKDSRILLTVLIRSHQTFASGAAGKPSTKARGKLAKAPDLALDASPASQKAMAAHDGEAGEELVDIWTFARDIHSSNPNWQLVSTRSPV